MKLAPILICLLAVVYAAPTEQQFINDLNTLNYILGLENWESALYGAFLARFPTATEAGVSDQFYNYIKQSGAAVSSHADAFNISISTLKWPVAPPCDFSFINDLTSPDIWLETIRATDNVVAGAYTYASQYFTNAGFLQFAATVATVKARHASFFNVAFGVGKNINPFPEAIETGLPLATILDINYLGPLFASCSESANVVCFDGVIRNVSFHDHFPGKRNAPRLANLFRSPSGTFPVGPSPEADVGEPKLSQAAYARDTLVLQYALTAENAENAFYNLTLTKITREAFVNYFVGSVSPFSEKPNAGDVYDYLVLIGQHEARHVAFLNQALTARGTSGVPACSYPRNFTELGFDGTPLGLLKSAQSFENFGVAAYTGAITLLSDNTLVATVAAVALTEARHAAYLQVLVKAAGLLPNADLTAGGQSYDVPSFPTRIATTLFPLLGTCPNIKIPDSNNSPFTYNSLTIPNIQALNDLAASPTKDRGYADAGPYEIIPTTSTNSISTSSTRDKTTNITEGTQPKETNPTHSNASIINSDTQSISSSLSSSDSSATIVLPSSPISSSIHLFPSLLIVFVVFLLHFSQ